MNVIIRNSQGVGDHVVLTRMVRDLRESHPHFDIWLDVKHPEVFAGNPDIQPGRAPARISSLAFDAGYRVEDWRSGCHFAHAWHNRLESVYGVALPRGDVRPILYPQPLPERLAMRLPSCPYIVIDAGYQADFTAKHWGTARWQAVVDGSPSRYAWVQIGSRVRAGRHVPLRGVVDLIDQTTIAELISIIAGAHGVVGPVSCPAHIAAGCGRQAITIAGGREPASWESYEGHWYLDTIDEQGPCWRSAIAGECRRGVSEGHERVAMCMTQITPDAVLEIIHGDAWLIGGQTNHREHSALASGGRPAGPVNVRCGETRCGGQGSRRQQRA